MKTALNKNTPSALASIVMEIEPFETPKHKASMVEPSTSKLLGSVTKAESIAVHPFASCTTIL